jgi:predicted membrane-bound mannosyltransferase
MRFAAAGILLVAAALRLPMLDLRPMHADEAILADKLGTLVESGAYPYDPREYHGPVIGYLAWIPAKAVGVSETTLRLLPAICGVLLALAPLLFAPWIGRGAAVAAGAMVAVSPALVYYSRYYIPEMPLALWTSLMLLCVLRGWWFAGGLAAALMIATKETAVLALAAAGVAHVAVYRPRRVSLLFPAGLLLGISLLLAPPWQWGLLAQSAVAYFERAGRGVHAHPWYTYLRWIAITEAPLLVAGGFALRHTGKPAVRFLGLYAIGLVVLYSAIPYKTPWCAVSPLFALALAGGAAVEGLHVRWRVAIAACLSIAAALTATRYSTDPRNPWVYAHTGAGVYTIRDRLAAFPRDTAIDVYARENWWPLPWYLRAYPNVRWWREVAPAGSAARIVLLSPAMEADLVRKLYEGPPPGERELYMNLFEGQVELRPGVEVRGYVAKSLWDRAR